jgi:hypothetical protein
MELIDFIIDEKECNLETFDYYLDELIDNR